MNSKSRSGMLCWSESRAAKETFTTSEKPYSTSGENKTKLHHWAGQTIRSTISLVSIKDTVISRSSFIVMLPDNTSIYTAYTRKTTHPLGHKKHITSSAWTSL